MAARKIRYVCEFNYLEPWISPDHVAFTHYRARGDGQRDGRSLGECHTLPVAIVLEATTLGEALDLLEQRGDICTFHNEEWLLASALRELWFGRGVELWAAIREVYPIARDYVMDNIHLRDGFVAMMRERAVKENLSPALMPI